NSLTRSAPLANDSQARSGARFHTSYDKRYIIKTITSEDVAEMHNILKKYHQNLKALYKTKYRSTQVQIIDVVHSTSQKRSIPTVSQLKQYE
ncbi:hypothetical protein EK904_005779, partial [Melospiza melodia maxima]